jgi:hypothetical protein
MNIYILYTVTSLGLLLSLFWTLVVFLGKRIGGENDMPQVIRYGKLQVSTNLVLTNLALSLVTAVVPLILEFYITLNSSLSLASSREVPNAENVRRSDEFSAAMLEEYKVVLGADPLIKMPGVPGELRVWIGSSSVDPNLPGYMTRATEYLPAIGETAKVTPFAPAFEIEPNESICVGIDRTGSAVRFRLRPTRVGTFNVGADVQLFHSSDCSGAPVPKSTETLQITVVVDKDDVLQERTKRLGEVLWEKFLDFWGLSVALFFALLLFLIRGRLKKWFSFKSDN